ncbi:dachshund homolog 2 isoform X2 [Bombyx mandarina]|uniref:SKI/SNO/DAC domain-containing protein n=2 Tax=Bombyx TaxID=7090 RepID=A0A8R2HSB0_BOMMO|nr:dachshund homolog 2 isoform X3 [Bombyx mori]XP_028034430.1 dachshund homolog 2 isoform X1 [Bombyx mandarina]XP_028034431.1 dachshund homolog 2 isoform X2 [Bombyx mandarina]
MESAVDSASTASEVSGSSGGSPRVKAASPARALSPPQLMAPRLPLPPPGLGLLGSLQMMHHSPLELMAAAHHHGPPRYGSPPPISTSDPSANECKLVDYRGQKVAAFIIQGDTMLCLPQAFELFLKHLVGGLHTVYTKLKRLDIVPLVCNVEQVRILRGLGAIQPGVNRCKLLSCKDFDVLYKDCTTARCLSMKAPDSSRPGRPPKRATGVGLSLAATQFPGHPFKKHRLENGDYSPYENGHMSEMARLEKSPLLANGYNAPPTHLGPMGFMHQHALMSPGMPHHGVPRPDGSIIKGQPMHNMEALARSGIWENCRAAYEDIVKHLERLRDERGDMERVMAMDKAREGSHNGSSPGHSPVLNLSKSGSGGDRERSDRNDRERGERGDGSASGRSSAASRRTPQPPRMPSTATAAVSPRSHSDDSDAPLSDQDDHNVKDEDEVYYLSSGGDMSDGERDIPASTSPAPVSYPPPTVTPTSVPVDPTADTLVSSTETLLRNIQGLLKVAADNARQQERQISYEKAELKMDVLREREVKDNLERQLVDEQKLRVIYQKRLKKERKQRQVVQEQLDIELKRRQKIEEALKQSGAPQEILRIVTENLSPAGQEQGRHERENGSESKPPSTEPPSTSPPFQRDPPRTPDKPQWNYPPPPVDIMSGGAAFWQNYSESLAQELEMERKSRQQAMERDVKSPLSDRAGYYKNSVLFSSAT